MDPTATSKIWIPDKRWYKLPGYDLNDDVIVFKKKANLSINDNLMIGYDVDMIGYDGDVFNNHEYNNKRIHCVDVGQHHNI